MDIYYATYDRINGTIHNSWTTLAEPEFGGMISYPFISGLPIAQLCMDYAASRVDKANNSVMVANLWAEYFSTCAITVMAGTLDPLPTAKEQFQNNSFIATRVSIVPLFVLLGFKFFYCLAVLCLAVAGYHYTDPAESQSVKERLTIKGLTATYFCDGPSHRQAAVKKVEQLFQPPVLVAKSVGDPEAIVLAERKIGMLQTEMGGWQYVKIVESKDNGALPPMVEK